MRRVPNAYCPNALPGALDCSWYAPHRHCACGLPIGEDEDPMVVAVIEKLREVVLHRCRHDPLDRDGLKTAFGRFPMMPIIY